MKRVFLTCLTAFIISVTKSHVTERQSPTTENKKNTENEFDIKNITFLEPTVSANSYEPKELSDKEHAFKSNDNFEKSVTGSTDDKNPENLVGNKKNVLGQKSSENKFDAKRVYLEDVVFALKNQDWSKEELPCLNATLHMLRSLQNFTLWAVWEWDSISSQPQGLLFGNRYELGNFDECMNAPWTKTHPELTTQYCLAEIQLERTDKYVKKMNEKPVQPYDSALDYVMRNKSSIHRPLNELTWGGCVPASCGARATERLMATLLARSHLGTAGIRARIAVTEPCQRPDQYRHYDGKFYGFMILSAILLMTSLICTYMNCKKSPDHNCLKYDIIKCFCLKSNSKDLLSMKKEGAEILYGIRFLTLVFIAMDHQIAIFNSGPVSNGLQVDQETLGVWGMFVLHDDLFVDTFFALSGFLMALALERLKDKPVFNPLLFIVKRYIRITVAYAVIIFFIVAVYPYVGSGPLWNRAVAGETDPCIKNWWLSLLMLGNYINDDNICLIVSWYIPTDFHFFLVTVLVFWAYTRWPRLGVACAGILTVASVCTPGVIHYTRRLPALPLFTYDFVRNPRANELFHLTYIKSHTRFAAYIVGFFAGYYLAICKKSGNVKIISTKNSVLGAVVGVAIMTAVMMVGTTYLWRSYHPLEGAIYAALNRPVWACGLVLLILCCCLGRVPFVEGFLSWYPWVPLSRLSYGLYLTHSLLVTRNVYVTRSPNYNDIVTILTLSLGVVVIGCVAALAIWLFAEAPINNLFTVIVKSRVQQAMPREGKNVAPSSSDLVAAPSSSSVASTSGHLHTNLPSTIEISSKM